MEVEAGSLTGQQCGDIPSYLMTYLYVGHFLARWGARMWEFSVALYMVSIWPNSLLLVAVYGAMESASTALFGSVVGQCVDRLTYDKVLRVWLFTQNLSHIVAGVSVIWLLLFSDLKDTHFVVFVSLVILTNISGSIGTLSTLAGTILVEREWVVAISENKPSQVLTKRNSVIRQIDLICKLFAPVVTGFIISFVSLKASAMALALWTTITVWLEYWLLTSVYTRIPALIERSEMKLGNLVQIIPETCNSEDTESLITHSIITDETTWIQKRRDFLSKFPCVGAWKIYLQQDVVLPGVALALLYFTVLSFGTLMTATLEWEGIPTYVIGIARGVSASIGIAATLIYPLLHSHILTLRTGLWSIWCQFVFLLVCVASIWVQNSMLSAYILMGGVAASRLGLWMFDLSVIQQMQDHVPATDRCVVGGVQNQLQSILDLMAYVTGIFISNTQDFWKLIILSFFVASLAATLYSVHIYRVRKHLFHFEKLLVFVPWFIGRAHSFYRSLIETPSAGMHC